jgi:hypothetical protein
VGLCEALWGSENNTTTIGVVSIGKDCGKPVGIGKFGKLFRV